MQMMVVQPGQHCTGGGIDHLLGVEGVEPIGDFDDPLRDPDIDDPTVRHSGTANQHVVSLASTSSRTRPLSAPRSGAGTRGSLGIRGGRVLFEFTVCGNVAYSAATSARAISTISPPPRPSESSTAPVAARPVKGSAIASPTNSTPAPTRPPATAASSPNATRSARAPSVPYPVTRSQIRPSRPRT